MFAYIDPVEEQDVAGDAFDEEVGAFEAMFGALEDLSALEDLEAGLADLESAFDFNDSLDDLTV